MYVSPWVEGKDINVCFCVGEETELYFSMGSVYASWCMGGTCWCIYECGLKGQRYKCMRVKVYTGGFMYEGVYMRMSCVCVWRRYEFVSVCRIRV